MRSAPNVAIPSGSVYPDGLPMTEANPVVQASVRPEGTYFVSSLGYDTVRPGRNRYQHAKGSGIHFTPMRFAENVADPTTLPVMVDVTTAPDHVDVADLPGTADLDRGVLLGESPESAPTGGVVRHRGTKTVSDMGDREPHRPLSQVFHGFGDPVAMFRAEYAKNPLVAVAAAVGVTGIVYMIARDFEASYRSRTASARRGGGVTANAAPVAGVSAAAADTSGNTVEQVADTAAEAVEAVGDGVAAVVEATGEAVEQVTEAAADAVSSD